VYIHEPRLLCINTRGQAIKTNPSSNLDAKLHNKEQEYLQNICIKYIYILITPLKVEHKAWQCPIWTTKIRIVAYLVPNMSNMVLWWKMNCDQFTRENAFSNKMTINLYMFCPLVEDRIIYNVQYCLIITKEFHRKLQKHSQQCKIGSNPNELTSHISHCSVFSMLWKIRDYSLFPSLPRNGCQDTLWKIIWW